MDLKEVDLPANVCSTDTNQFGQILAAASTNGTITFYSAKNFTILSTVTIANATPLSISFSSTTNDRSLAVGASDGTVRILSQQPDGKWFETQKLGPQKSSVISVAFHCSLSIIAAGSLDGSFAIYTKNGNTWTATTVPVSPLGITSVAWGLDSAANPSLLTLFVGGVDGTVRVYTSGGNGWGMSTAKSVHNGWVRRISVPKVASGGKQKIATCGDDAKVAVLYLKDNTIEVNYIDNLDFAATDVAWAMVDKTLVVQHTNGTSSFWHKNENGELVQIKDE